MLSPSDRRLLRQSALMLFIGVMSFGGALWIALDPETDLRRKSVLGFVVGPAFIVIAVFALVRRLVRGPEPPGRHARD